jgi:twitching motility protein PilT
MADTQPIPITINKTIGSVTKEGKVCPDIFTLLTEANTRGASDIHLSVEQKPIFRVQGDIERQDYLPLTYNQMEKMIFDTMNETQKETFLRVKDLDYCIEIPDVARYRVNTLFNNRGPAVVFRIIPSEIIPFEALNLPEVLRRIVDMDKGLVLVTGPTGSGKSTTLAAIIDLINQSKDAHLVTVEDPVEFVHRSKKCLIQHREVGVHTKSFATALRSSLREDVDIVLVGELRELETIELALSAAETGALVFGTLHTSSAAKTVSRIIDVFPSDEQDKVRSQLGEAVQAIVAQVLLKKIGGGRCAAQEILFGSRAISNMIEANQISQIANTLEISKQEGMNSMDQALIALIKSGKITKEQALIHAKEKNQFDLL